MIYYRVSGRKNRQKHFTSYSTESQKNAIEYNNITARLDKRGTYLIANQ